ncbi:hypothetical protein EYF80_024785 [Liparis tanakae]|uniref:Uncharacterized protein n=1 Tax=Liparis tanakae TaxID=230148 RepID=A0A4Z2HH37_9TELE|nr:hypothetical protein EYF80_024785 [Liparis tanakae]
MFRRGASSPVGQLVDHEGRRQLDGERREDVGQQHRLRREAAQRSEVKAVIVSCRLCSRRTSSFCYFQFQFVALCMSVYRSGDGVAVVAAAVAAVAAAVSILEFHGNRGRGLHRKGKQ